MCIKQTDYVREEYEKLKEENEKLKLDIEMLEFKEVMAAPILKENIELKKEIERLRAENNRYAEWRCIKDNDRAIFEMLKERADYYQAMLYCENKIKELKKENQDLRTALDEANENILYERIEILEEENKRLKTHNEKLKEFYIGLSTENTKIKDERESDALEIVALKEQNQQLKEQLEAQKGLVEVYRESDGLSQRAVDKYKEQLQQLQSDEPEYCGISGVKLDKKPKCDKCKDTGVWFENQKGEILSESEIDKAVWRVTCHCCKPKEYSEPKRKPKFNVSDQVNYYHFKKGLKATVVNTFNQDNGFIKIITYKGGYVLDVPVNDCKRLVRKKPKHLQCKTCGNDIITSAIYKSETECIGCYGKKIASVLKRPFDMYVAKFTQSEHKSHKCPVCDGKRKIMNNENIYCVLSIDAMGNRWQPCLTCNATGIVWEPK